MRRVNDIIPNALSRFDYHASINNWLLAKQSKCVRGERRILLHTNVFQKQASFGYNNEPQVIKIRNDKEAWVISCVGEIGT